MHGEEAAAQLRVGGEEALLLLAGGVEGGALGLELRGLEGLSCGGCVCVGLRACWCWGWGWGWGGVHVGEDIREQEADR